MKLNVTAAKKQTFKGATIFYVPSKSGGETHIVVKTLKGTFCDCKDFMTRKLPVYGTPEFSLCIHAKQVSEVPLRSSKPGKYGLFVYNGRRSIDYPQTFATKKAAELFLTDLHGKDRNFRHVGTIQ